jgi:FixJ family two-component response regulator
MKVCVVDDDASMRRALRRLLKAANYDVIEFETAEALLKSEQVGSVGCLISDLNLPGLSGLQLMDLLKQTSPAPPIIVITSFDSPGLQENVLNRGAFGYLKKPFEGEDLLEMIRRVGHPP